MWMTQDGYRLTITPSVVATFSARHRQLGLSELVLRNYRGNLDRAVRRSLAQIVAAAYRTGALRNRWGRSYPAFTSAINGRGYIVIARPLADGRYAIVAIRPRPEREQEQEQAKHGGKASVDWTGSLPVDQAIKEPGGGVYVLEYQGVPVYVGEGGAYAGDAGRLRKRVEMMRQAGVPLDQYTVRLGKMVPGPERNKKLDDRRREMVEHTAILDLNQLKAQQGQQSLKNEKSIRPYDVMPEGVEILHRGTVPPYIQHLRGGDGVQRITGNQDYTGRGHPQLSLPFPLLPSAPTAPQMQQLVLPGMGLQASRRPASLSRRRPRRGRPARSRRLGGAWWPGAWRNREAEYISELEAALAEDYY